MQTSDAEAVCAAQLLPALTEQGEWEAAGATAPASTQAAAGLHCSQQQLVQPPEVQQIGGRSQEPDGTTTGLAAQASGSVGSEAGGLWALPEPVGLVLMHPGAWLWLAVAAHCWLWAWPCRAVCPQAPACAEAASAYCWAPLTRTRPSLHADLSGHTAPKYMRVLAQSRLGRRVLRR